MTKNIEREMWYVTSVFFQNTSIVMVLCFTEEN